MTGIIENDVSFVLNRFFLTAFFAGLPAKKISGLEGRSGRFAGADMTNIFIHMEVNKMKKITSNTFLFYFFFTSIAAAWQRPEIGFNISAFAFKKNADVPDELVYPGYSIYYKSKKTSPVGIHQYKIGPGIYTIEFDKKITKGKYLEAALYEISVVDPGPGEKSYVRSSTNPLVDSTLGEKVVFRSSTNTISFLLKKNDYFWIFATYKK